MSDFLESSGQNVVFALSYAGQAVLSLHGAMFLLPLAVVSALSNALAFFVTGLCVISLPRQMAMQNAINHIQEIIQNTITLFKTEKILTNVNWTLVEEKTKIKYRISVSWCLASFPSWVCLSCFS